MSVVRALRPIASAPDDAALLSRIRQGHLGELGVLFDRYADDVRRVLSRLCGSHADVDDLLQATFLEVVAAAARYDGRASAKPWIVGLAVVQVRRHRRSFARLAARLSSWSREPRAQPPTPEALASVADLTRRTARALEALSDKKREVVVLVAVEGMSGEDVASALGIPVATVWTRLHHARRELEAAVFEEES